MGRHYLINQGLDMRITTYKKLLYILFIIVMIPSAYAVNKPNDVNAVSTVNAKLKQMINVNKADIKALAQLKGIGDKKAKAIVLYRQKNGKFKTVNDLLKIKGIGKKVLVDNKERLTI